ncbi:hypothetical protein CHS0354_027264, partial [Potamilus streckersoni]
NTVLHDGESEISNRGFLCWSLSVVSSSVVDLKEQLLTKSRIFSSHAGACDN